MTRNTYPQDTGPEFAPVAVTIDKTVVTTGVEFAIRPVGSTAAKVWVDAVIRDGKTGIIITALDPGFYEVSARVSVPPDTIVVDCGTFEIT